MWHGQISLLSHINGEDFPNAYMLMRLTAENVADRCSITREEMDEYAVQSQSRAVAAQESGFFDAEIVPIPLLNGTLLRREIAHARARR
jgi:acetyl-CoA acetyltransferase